MMIKFFYNLNFKFVENVIGKKKESEQKNSMYPL